MNSRRCRRRGCEFDHCLIEPRNKYNAYTHHKLQTITRQREESNELSDKRQTNTIENTYCRQSQQLGLSSQPIGAQNQLLLGGGYRGENKNKNNVSDYFG